MVHGVPSYLIVPKIRDHPVNIASGLGRIMARTLAERHGVQWPKRDRMLS